MLKDVTSVTFPAAREFLWEQVELPRRLLRDRVDLFHATANRGLPYRRVCKYVVTVHDIIDRLPEYCPGEHWRGRLRKRYADFISRHSADRYLTVSQFSKQEICRFHRLPPERVTVIPNGVAPRFFEREPARKIEQMRGKYGLPPEYFLFLGGFDRRKNALTLLDAYAQLPQDGTPLVLAGEHKWEFAAASQKIHTLELSERVVCPGAIADEDLPAVYQGALALVHPSRYEGFGLQLLEAMASGVPVLAANATSLPEVLGGCGLLFDPADAAAIAAQMQRIAAEPALRSSLAAQGRERTRSFSWRKAAEQTLALYLELLGRPGELAQVENSAAMSSTASEAAQERSR